MRTDILLYTCTQHKYNRCFFLYHAKRVCCGIDNTGKTDELLQDLHEYVICLSFAAFSHAGIRQDNKEDTYGISCH